MANHKKEQLVEFLDRKVFDPILRAPEAGKSASEREKLEDLKDRTRRTKQRYHEYEDAEKVKQMFRDDLRSEPAKRVQRESRDLGLPSLPDVEQELDELSSRLGV